MVFFHSNQFCHTVDGIFPIFIPVSKRLLQGLSTLFYVCISLGSGKAVKIIKMFFWESGVWYTMSGSVFVEKSTKAPRQYEICLSYEYVLSKCLHIPSPEENMKYGSKLKEYIENSKSSKRKFSRTSCGIFHERSKKVLKFLMEIW